MNIMFKTKKQIENLKKEFFINLFKKHLNAFIILIALIGCIVNEKLKGDIVISIIFLVIISVEFLILFYRNFSPYDKINAYWKRKNK